MPGLYFQKEGAKVTFGDALMVMPKGSEDHGPRYRGTTGGGTQELG